MRIQDQSHFCQGTGISVLNTTSPLPLPAYQVISWSSLGWHLPECSSSLGWCQGRQRTCCPLLSALLFSSLDFLRQSCQYQINSLCCLCCQVICHAIHYYITQGKHFNAHNPTKLKSSQFIGSLQIYYRTVIPTRWSQGVGDKIQPGDETD